MIGAIIGDIIGSTYEFIDNVKDKNFELFIPYSMTTDDSIMSLAIGQALVNTYKEKDIIKIQNELIKQMQKFGKEYPYSGYGLKLKEWLKAENSRPYNSFGNGSGMRVSSVAWLYDSLNDINKYAEITASVSHNHPEGIKGACAIASAIYLARENKSKEEIKKYIEDKFEYSFEAISEIRKWHTFDETCQVTVPIAIQAFLEGKDFEDVLINAIYAGGDTDTIACMACSIAEAYYEIPDKFLEFCYPKISIDLKEALKNILMLVKRENRLNNNLEKVLKLLEREK
ncbi:ADP-ribosylglycohydrolase family protein [Fusobacterium vincentii]|uniref:ADP-ribosylglycohydrolase family protein n=1 Tax=Fusobacterium vincentii TaxID=155615 RepID=UPI00325512D7